MSSKEQEYVDLCLLIVKAKYEYYMGDAVIPDAEYDRMERKLDVLSTELGLRDQIYNPLNYVGYNPHHDILARIRGTL